MSVGHAMQLISANIGHTIDRVHLGRAFKATDSEDSRTVGQ